MFPGQHGDRRGPSPSVGLERGSVSPRKVSSGEAVPIFQSTGQGYRPALARLKFVRVPFALYGLPNRPVPPAGELSGSGRATRCPTEELRETGYGATLPVGPAVE
jgi:hypothetical protein